MPEIGPANTLTVWLVLSVPITLLVKVMVNELPVVVPDSEEMVPWAEFRI